LFQASNNLSLIFYNCNASLNQLLCWKGDDMLSWDLVVDKDGDTTVVRSKNRKKEDSFVSTATSWTRNKALEKMMRDGEVLKTLSAIIIARTMTAT